MNIRDALNEIICTVHAYTAKDETGCYRIPAVNQRPVLLMGPPGIGKTAIMEQAARACGIGLVAYTITHHTRQSAVGLPQLTERTYDGKTYTLTEYTMSEIIGSVYEYRERTGIREGILFIDEINCVSETLAPTMLQFLQYKTFGTHRVPEGWIIVAAGNPKEFNRSVRELDMAALDRVRILNVEADYAVWREHVLSAGIHPAILSYLDIHPEHFYQVVKTREKSEFVTARGWADLSVVLEEYERQKLNVGPEFMGEFIRSTSIASEFTSFYQVYRSFAGTYRISELLEGRLPASEQEELGKNLLSAPADVRSMFVRHLLSWSAERMSAWGRDKRFFNRLKEVLELLKTWLTDGKDLKGFFQSRDHAFQVKKENDLLKPWEEQLEKAVDRELKERLYSETDPGDLKITGPDSLGALFDLENRQEKLKADRRTLCGSLDQAKEFLLRTFGEDLELFDWLQGIRAHGDFSACGYDCQEFALLLGQREQEALLKKQIKEMEKLYEAADCI